MCCCRPKSYLLVLLMHKAYQQHIAEAAGTGSANSSAASCHDEAVALGCILQNFLRLAAQLSSSTLLSWEPLTLKAYQQHIAAAAASSSRH
jgi:hypothetical protein